MPPEGILRRQSQHEVTDLRGDWRPARPGVRVRPVSGEQLAVPAKQRRRGDEERRPARAREQSRQCCEHDPVFWFESGAVHLAAQHRHLVAEYQDLDILGSSVAGELGQHLQDLAE
jgi:hypothetical protein